jgi:RimJ/RimL family protein N-acetyltransferase
MDLSPVVLEGRHVRLDPLELRHAPALFAAAQDDEVWRWMPVPRPASVRDVENVILEAEAQERHGLVLPFAIVDRAWDRIVGSTRFLDVRPVHRGLEIGWTWIGADYQRTALNTEAKLLLLGHAFGELGALRVQFKTDVRNERSQHAIERLGAVREGVLRRHMTCWDGSIRDSVMYSITDLEWPAVRAALEARLARG